MRYNPRGRLALAVSLLALVVAMSGTSYAAFKVGTKQLKNNSVTSSKIKNGQVKSKDIKNNQVKGSHVKESTLGQVPSAANADTTNGMSLDKVVYRSNGTTPPVAVFDRAGLKITVSCTDGDLALTATTSKQDSSIYSHLINVESGTVNTNDRETQGFDVGFTFDLLAGVDSATYNPAVVTFAYDNIDGSVATGTLSTDLPCAVTGTVTSG